MEKYLLLLSTAFSTGNSWYGVRNRAAAPYLRIKHFMILSSNNVRTSTFSLSPFHCLWKSVSCLLLLSWLPPSNVSRWGLFWNQCGVQHLEPHPPRRQNGHCACQAERCTSSTTSPAPCLRPPETETLGEKEKLGRGDGKSPEQVEEVVPRW